MHLLVLGGTVFLGRHVVEAALAGGHEVTLFNRGRSNPGLFPDVERLRGDRDGGLGALRGRSWDAVVDTCGYVPRVVGASAGLLRDAVGHYVFVSTQSVYASSETEGQDETAPLATLGDLATEEVTGETYGALKARCERAVEDALPGRATHVRSGLIVGPHDPTDRFTYWPWRAARGGAVLAPAPPDWPVEFVDVRDLAAWIVHVAEKRVAGVFNTAGPTTPRPTFAALLDACGAADVAWLDPDWLAARGVQPWSDLPLRAPQRGFSTRRADRARAAGFACRPMEDTVRDTLAWFRGENREPKTGLAADRKRELLCAIPCRFKNRRR